MTVLKILKYPDDRLRNISKPVEKINKKIKNIINNMIETMYQAHGIGLAAPQVNVHLRIIVVDIVQNYKPIILINPEKIHSNNFINTEEGCLSIPGITKNVTRSREITIQALNYHGETIHITANTLLSVCIQHELDHLVGRLIIDY